MTDNQAGPYYVLFDSSNAEVVAVIEKGLSTGDVLQGASIEELADAAGAPQLAATFEAYQQAAAAGADEAFGKKADIDVYKRQNTWPSATPTAGRSWSSSCSGSLSPPSRCSSCNALRARDRRRTA